MNELARRVAEATGVGLEQVHLPSCKEVFGAFCGHSACREVFSANSEATLEDGLRKMAAWVKKLGSEKSKTFKGIEVRRSLPQVWSDEI